MHKTPFFFLQCLRVCAVIVRAGRWAWQWSRAQFWVHVSTFSTWHGARTAGLVCGDAAFPFVAGARKWRYSATHYMQAPSDIKQPRRSVRILDMNTCSNSSVQFWTIGHFSSRLLSYLIALCLSCTWHQMYLSNVYGVFFPLGSSGVPNNDKSSLSLLRTSTWLLVSFFSQSFLRFGPSRVLTD